MSEIDNQEQNIPTPEVEDQSTEVEHDPIGDFIDTIASGDFNQSEKLFNDLLADKVQHSLEAQKIAVADTIFNGVEPEDLEIEAEEDI